MASKAPKKDLLKQALALPEKERAALAHELIASLDAPFDDPAEVDSAWREEVERRWAEVKTGRVSLKSWDDVHAEVTARLKRRN